MSPIGLESAEMTFSGNTKEKWKLLYRFRHLSFEKVTLVTIENFSSQKMLYTSMPQILLRVFLHRKELARHGKTNLNSNNNTHRNVSYRMRQLSRRA